MCSQQATKRPPGATLASWHIVLRGPRIGRGRTVTRNACDVRPAWQGPDHELARPGAACRWTETPMAMMAFDHVFLDVAERESQAIQTTDPRGRPATFVFREFYCADPGCDCRRVLLHVHWVEEE